MDSVLGLTYCSVCIMHDRIVATRGKLIVMRAQPLFLLDTYSFSLSLNYLRLPS